MLKGFSRLVIVWISRIDSFLNLSPQLNIILSRNGVSITEISDVNLIVGWKLLALSPFFIRISFISGTPV